MTDSELTSDIRAFLDEYNDAFASIDGRRIAALYHLPTVTMRGDGSIHCLQSREELATFLQRVADTYQKDGYAGGRFDDLQVSPIGGRSGSPRWIGRCCAATVLSFASGASPTTSFTSFPAGGS